MRLRWEPVRAADGLLRKRGVSSWGTEGPRWEPTPALELKDNDSSWEPRDQRGRGVEGPTRKAGTDNHSKE